MKSNKFRNNSNLEINNNKLLKAYNNSLIYNRKENIKKNLMNKKTNKNNYDNSTNNNIIKYKYRNNNCSIFSPKKRKNLKNNYINCSVEDNTKNILISNIQEKYIETNGSLLSYNSKKFKINKYKESINKKRELLGISLNIKEKNKAQKEIYDEFSDYDKEKEEIEKKILINDEIIKNEENIFYSKYKKRNPRRIFSGDFSNYTNNKSIDKLYKKSIDSTFNYEHNNSKSEISYFQTDYNKDELRNKSKNLKYKKRNNDLRNNNSFVYRKSLNNFNINKTRNNKYGTNNSLINNRSYMDIFIKEENMKKNINTIVKDIIKILNKSKSKKKINKTPRKPREKIFSPRKEIIMIQNNENGKTLRCIKRRSRDKSRFKVERIIENQNIEEEPQENNNTDNSNNDINMQDKENKEENKKLEINIPGGEIEALRRIKNRIENYKKNQRRNKYGYRIIKKFKSFYLTSKKMTINRQIIIIKRLNSEKLFVKLKNM